MKKISFVVFFLLITTFCGAQEIHSALKINASTDGLGGDIVFSFNKYLAARAGANYFSVPYKFDYDGIKGLDLGADIKYRMGNISAYVDFYMVRWLYVTAGVGVSLFQLRAYAAPVNGMKYGDITIPSEKVGHMDISINPGLKVNPYLGLGFGRTIPALKSVGFSFEMGCTYLGSPKVTVNSSEMLSPNMEQTQIDNYNKIVERYKFLPSIKFGLSIKLF